MLRIITLLNQKNHYLEKFYALNETEILNFSKSNFDNLEPFYNMRDKILEIIKYLDSQIDATQKNMEGVLSREIKNQIKEALTIKDEYVGRIIAQDLEILSCIEIEKSKIIRELQGVSKTKNVMSRYKSGQTGSPQVDEEV